MKYRRLIKYKENNLVLAQKKVNELAIKKINIRKNLNKSY